MLILQNLSYIHPNQDLLLDHIDLMIGDHEKVALTGNNGVGKSVLLKIIAGLLPPSGGLLQSDAIPYYVPQVFGQYNELTIGYALGVADKINALQEILSGHVTEHNLSLLDDDWGIEERCSKALSYWGLGDLNLSRKMGTLSGGQKTKVFLAGIAVHQPKFILLDEPSNHLDMVGRPLLYDFIESAPGTLIVVSHDRALLNLLSPVCELSKGGIRVYGGNYDFYAEQKALEQQAWAQDLSNKEKALRKAKEQERASQERQQKLDVRGKQKQEKAGLPTISMNTFKNNAENSTARLMGVHTDKVDGIAREIAELRAGKPVVDEMKFGFDDATLHHGKVLFDSKEMNYEYEDRVLWREDLNFQIIIGERIALQGRNGSGKTSLIKIILGKLETRSGSVYRAGCRAIYIDQDYSLIDDGLNVYQQAQEWNRATLQEHEIKIRLNRFLFSRADWDKSCRSLSGGEKMRLLLCCLTLDKRSPDMIVLDEPTNNLDLKNIHILTAAINAYRGTLLVVSHDRTFLEQVNIGRRIQL
jgi:ATPase subunit of ABC transporter with duplicated ATPase domains